MDESNFDRNYVPPQLERPLLWRAVPSDVRIECGGMGQDRLFARSEQSVG